MDKLANIILEYESDTFNARREDVTRLEASRMAVALFDRLCEVVEEGGRLSCDGLTLAELLEDIREHTGRVK